MVLSPPISLTKSNTLFSLYPPSSVGSISCASSSTPHRSTNSEIPDHWCPEIEHSINEKQFSSSSRNEIVRVLVSQLFCKTTKPTRLQCEELARKFILKYPFAKDDLGNGYVSHFYMYFVGGF